jgi:hypothetical protein
MDFARDMSLAAVEIDSPRLTPHRLGAFASPSHSATSADLLETPSRPATGTWAETERQLLRLSDVG